MFCPYCGSQLEEGAFFCTNCGAKVATKTESGFSSKSTGPEEVPDKSKQATGSEDYSDKSKLVAGLLGILLGGLGVHNFYLGFTGKGVAQLLLSILSFGLLSWISVIWGLVEGIMILVEANPRDAKGKIMKN